MQHIGFGYTLILNLGIIICVIAALFILKNGLVLLALAYLQQFPMSAKFSEEEEPAHNHMGFVDTDSE